MKIPPHTIQSRKEIKFINCELEKYKGLNVRIFSSRNTINPTQCKAELYICFLSYFLLPFLFFLFACIRIEFGMNWNYILSRHIFFFFFGLVTATGPICLMFQCNICYHNKCDASHKNFFKHFSYFFFFFSFWLFFRKAFSVILLKSFSWCHLRMWKSMKR